MNQPKLAPMEPVRFANDPQVTGTVSSVHIVDGQVSVEVLWDDSKVRTWHDEDELERAES